MNNWWDTVRDAARTRKRLDIFASVLEQELKRIVGWSYVDCIIGNSWAIESGEYDADPVFSFYEEILGSLVDAMF